MLVRDIIKRVPITVADDTSLGDAMQLMEDHHIRHLPVVQGDRLCGMLSARDILYYRALTAFCDGWSRAPVTAAMSVPVETADLDETLTQVTERFAEARIGALPVVDHGVLRGLITLSDVLDAEVREAMA